MIPLLLGPLADEFILFNLARYLTFRAGAACMTALFVAMFFGKDVINWLRSFQPHGQPIRLDGPEGHLITKKGTPTMGGVVIGAREHIERTPFGDLLLAFRKPMMS